MEQPSGVPSRRAADERRPSSFVTSLVFERHVHLGGNVGPLCSRPWKKSSCVQSRKGTEWSRFKTELRKRASDGSSSRRSLSSCASLAARRAFAASAAARATSARSVSDFSNWRLSSSSRFSLAMVAIWRTCRSCETRPEQGMLPSSPYNLVHACTHAATSLESVGLGARPSAQHAAFARERGSIVAQMAAAAWCAAE
eukprot:scaffold63464_cov30-Tisochrysis_lutea.AAC.4